MISVKNIYKSFGKHEVLKGIDLNIGEGKIVGLLGPNGSGKTTLMKSILGLILPGKGEILVDGGNIKNAWSYREKIGYMPQIARFPENLTVRELIKLIENMRNQKGFQKEELIEIFELQPFMKNKLRNLSGGTRQKVNALLALMFDAPILVFDEPTVGLDPYSRIQFKKYVKAEKEKGKSILMTTHVLSEIEELADEIVFILEGKVYFQGTLEDLKLTHDSHNLEEAIAKITKKEAYMESGKKIRKLKTGS